MKKYLGFLIPAGLLIAVGAEMFFVLPGYRFGGLVLWLCAAAVLWFMALRAVDNKATRALRKVSFCVLALVLLITAATLAYIAAGGIEGDNAGADYAVVLGAGVNGTAPSASLAARLQAALEYAEANPDTVFILSGAQGRGEEITEAECMRRWLTSRGIFEDRLILETRASSTEENIFFSAKLIFAREPGFDGRICVVTECYHAARAKLYAGRAGFDDVVCVTGYTGLPVLTGSYYLRECVAVWAAALGLK